MLDHLQYNNVLHDNWIFENKPIKAIIFMKIAKNKHTVHLIPPKSAN